MYPHSHLGISGYLSTLLVAHGVNENIIVFSIIMFNVKNHLQWCLKSVHYRVFQETSALRGNISRHGAWSGNAWLGSGSERGLRYFLFHL